PDVEEFEPEAARLAVNLGLDRCPACDERGIADHAHVTVGKASALILGLARSHRLEPGRLRVGDGGGMGVEKLIVSKPLHSLPVSSNHRGEALVFQGENFLFAAHSIPPLRYRRPSKQEITARGSYCFVRLVISAIDCRAPRMTSDTSIPTMPPPRLRRRPSVMTVSTFAGCASSTTLCARSSTTS